MRVAQCAADVHERRVAAPSREPEALDKVHFRLLFADWIGLVCCLFFATAELMRYWQYVLYVLHSGHADTVRRPKGESLLHFACVAGDSLGLLSPCR